MSDVEMAEIDADDDLNISDGKGILSGSEEGEINESDSDSASSRHRHKVESESIKNTAIKYSFQTEVNNSINRSIFDDVDLAKMGDRATRFGFDKESGIKSLEKEKTDLYESLSIVTQEDIRHARLDTIHVNGVENMKTSDVFEYFFTHKPLFLEWVSDSSCNVVWTDDNSAAKAMVFYSKEILLDSDNAMDGKEIAVKTGDSVRLADIKVPIPPGRWRAGAPHPAADFIFLRFANKSDKKVSGNDEMKVLSKKYKESINTENIQTGLISESMKSKIKSMKENVYDLDEDKGKNPWGELCETWGINDSQEVFGIPKPSIADLPPPHAFPQRKYLSVRHRIGKAAGPHGALPVTERLSMPVAYGRNGGNVKTRLGKRTPEVIHVSDSSESEKEEEQHQEEDSGSSDDSEEEWTSKRKVPRMRMHADDEEEKINKKKINPDQSSTPWDEDDADIDTITIEVKNEIVERPRATVDSEEDDVRTNKSRPKTAKRDLRSRIGRRKSSNDSDSDASSSPQQSYTRHSAPAVATVWSRLDNSRSKQIESCSDSGSESPRDLRRTLTKSTAKIISNRPGFNKDLRSRLGKKSDFRASPLRIEVDNEHYARSDKE